MQNLIVWTPSEKSVGLTTRRFLLLSGAAFQAVGRPHAKVTIENVADQKLLSVPCT